MSNEDFANCYMPYSEIITIAMNHSVNNAYTFVKDDINLPCKEIIFSLESEFYETKDNNNEERFEDADVKQSKMVDNLIGHATTCS
jgi:hypothetical protein